MNAVRILLANEPRSYREAIAGAIRNLKPLVEVDEVEPEALDSEVERYAPHLVICSRLTPLVESEALAWVELYPGHGALSSVGLRGERSTVARMELAELLAIADQAEIMAEGT